MNPSPFITAGYDGKALVRGIPTQIPRGECILLAGRNGSGKTSLLRTLAGQLPPVEGYFDGRTTCFIPTGIPQVKGFRLKAFIRTALYRESSWRGRLSPGEEAAIDKALQLLHLEDFAERDIASLSDGEFRKACLCVALSRQSGLILLDEPTAYLDIIAREEVLATLRDISHHRGISLVFSTHELRDALPYADRAWVIADGHLHISTNSPAAMEELLQKHLGWLR